MKSPRKYFLKGRVVVHKKQRLYPKTTAELGNVSLGSMDASRLKGHEEQPRPGSMKQSETLKSGSRGC